MHWFDNFKVYIIFRSENIQKGAKYYRQYTDFIGSNKKLSKNLGVKTYFFEINCYTVRISIFSNFICARQKIKFKNNQATFYQPLYLDMNFVLLTYKNIQSIFKQYQKKHQCKTIGSGLSFKDLPFINNMVEIRSYQNHYHQ